MKRTLRTMRSLMAAFLQAISHPGMRNHDEALVCDPATKYFRW